MRLLCFLAILALLCWSESSHADKPGPSNSYKKITSDGKHVFAMISPRADEDELDPAAKAIRAMYVKSGLYKNDDSKDPLWTVDWYRHQVDVLPDGVHLIRHGRWPTLKGKFKDKTRTVTKDDLKQEAVSFFARGKLLREYSIGELVDDPQRLPMSVSHFRWLKTYAIVENGQELKAVTLDGNDIRFEIATGKIMEKKKAN